MKVRQVPSESTTYVKLTIVQSLYAILRIGTTVLSTLVKQIRLHDIL
jgi:hypothetical protein